MNIPTRHQIWKFCSKRHPQNTVLSPHLIAIRAALFPRVTLLWLLERNCGYDPLTCSWTVNGRRFSYQFFDQIAVAAKHGLAVTVRLDEHGYSGKTNVNLRLHSIASVSNRDGEIELRPERGFADVTECDDIA